MNHILAFKYNSDVRKKYLDAIEKLPWGKAIKDRGASFHSIRNVFLHVLDAYRYWFEYAIKDNLKDYKRSDHASSNNIDKMRKYEREVNTLVMSFVQNLRENDLDEVYDFKQGSRKGPLEAILMHMIEEELQHRGEINCMFWQQDIDPPITGYGE